MDYAHDLHSQECDSFLAILEEDPKKWTLPLEWECDLFRPIKGLLSSDPSSWKALHFIRSSILHSKAKSTDVTQLTQGQTVLLTLQPLQVLRPPISVNNLYTKQTILIQYSFPWTSHDAILNLNVHANTMSAAVRRGDSVITSVSNQALLSWEGEEKNFG